MPAFSKFAKLSLDRVPRWIWRPILTIGTILTDAGLIVRLLMVVLIALIPALAFQIRSESQAHAARRQLMRDEGLRLLHLVRSEQQRIIEGAEQVLSVIANAPAVRAQVPEDCKPLLVNLLKEQTRYSYADVVTLDGTPFCTPGAAANKFNAFDRPYFQRALQSGGLAVSEYSIGRFTGVSSIHIARPFRYLNGAIAGVALVGLSLEWLNEQIAKVDLPPGSVLAIGDRNGVFLARNPDGMKFVGRSQPPDRAFLMEGNQIQTLDGVAALDTGRRKLVTFSPPGADPNGLMVAVSLDEESAFAAIAQADRVGLALIIVGALLALALTAAMGHRLIRRPVAELIDVADQWRSGALGARTSLRHRRDEFGHLASAFDSMAETLEARERNLRESEARRRDIFDTQFENILLLAPDGTVMEANRSVLQMTGLTRDEIIGQPIWQAAGCDTADGEGLAAEISQVVQGAVIHRVLEITLKNGETRRLDFSLKPMCDPASGEVTAILAESRDLTKVHDLTLQLAQAHKERALGQLAGGIAHDFNNILQITMSAAHAIEQYQGDHDRCTRAIGRIVAACERGTSITHRLLSFARRGELRVGTIATAELLDNVREMLAQALGASIAVSVEVPDDIPPVVADRLQLETALINLGTNARDAMPDGGELILAAKVGRVRQGDQQQAGLPPGRYVCISVTDNGTGMDAATLARVSEPFFTTKPVGQGTGLGVPMVKGFAEQSSGGLTIVSTLGVGTTVTIWLPYAKDEGRHVREDDNAGAAPATGSIRVLLVEDDDLVRETLVAALEGEGVTTIAAASGQDALALIESGTIVDAIVSDFSMPGMHGAKTIQKARELRPGLPCILLTGYLADLDLQSADDFTLLHKPITGRELRMTIEARTRDLKASNDLDGELNLLLL